MECLCCGVGIESGVACQVCIAIEAIKIKPLSKKKQLFNYLRQLELPRYE